MFHLKQTKGLIALALGMTSFAFMSLIVACIDADSSLTAASPADNPQTALNSEKMVSYASTAPAPAPAPELRCNNDQIKITT